MEKGIKELRKEYALLSKKYKLPEFDKLNEDFEIEKLENKETAYFVRAVRKVVMEKIVNSLSFLEMLMNPVNVPRMYLICVKSLNQKDMNSIERIYGVFSDIILSALQLEIEYSEKHEAEMINQVYEKWNSVKKPFNEIISRLKCSSLLNPESIKKEKSYFG